MARRIWRVQVDDKNYSHHDNWLLEGNSAAVVEKKAMGLSGARQKDLVKGEARVKPYIRSIEFIGDLDG